MVAQHFTNRLENDFDFLFQLIQKFYYTHTLTHTHTHSLTLTHSLSPFVFFYIFSNENHELDFNGTPFVRIHAESKENSIFIMEIKIA